MSRAINFKDGQVIVEQTINLIYPSTKEDRDKITSRQRRILALRSDLPNQNSIYSQPEVAYMIGVSTRTVQRDERRVREVLFAQ